MLRDRTFCQAVDWPLKTVFSALFVVSNKKISPQVFLKWQLDLWRRSMECFWPASRVTRIDDRRLDLITTFLLTVLRSHLEFCSHGQKWLSLNISNKPIWYLTWEMRSRTPWTQMLAGLLKERIDTRYGIYNLDNARRHQFSQEGTKCNILGHPTSKALKSWSSTLWGHLTMLLTTVIFASNTQD